MASKGQGSEEAGSGAVAAVRRGRDEACVGMGPTLVGPPRGVRKDGNVAVLAVIISSKLGVLRSLLFCAEDARAGREKATRGIILKSAV